MIYIITGSGFLLTRPLHWHLLLCKVVAEYHDCAREWSTLLWKPYRPQQK